MMELFGGAILIAFGVLNFAIAKKFYQVARTNDKARELVKQDTGANSMNGLLGDQSGVVCKDNGVTIEAVKRQ